MFCYKIAENLGQSVGWVMQNVTDIEFEGWAKYYNWLNKQQSAKGPQPGHKRK